MTEHQTMNTVIHAAFRRDLGRFDTALGAFPAGSQPRADELARAWDNFEYQLRHHHDDEETIFWPALRELGAGEAMMGELGGEHETMLGSLDGAAAAMHQLHLNPSADNAAAARSAIADLRTNVADHLAHEERDLEPLAAAQVKSPQMKAAQRAVRKSAKGKAGTFFAWLQDGADADARAALRRDVPPPVLFVITKLGGRQYRNEIAPVWAA